MLKSALMNVLLNVEPGWEPKPKHRYRVIGRTRDGLPIRHAQLIDTGKYTPHQGKRECARRVRQMEKAAKEGTCQ